MAKKKTLDELKARNEKLSASVSEINTALSEKQKALTALQKQIAEEERKARTHNLCEFGGLAYKYFGDDITASEFKDMLDFIFAVDEVQNFVNDEKKKRFLRDNQTVVLDVSKSVDETTPIITESSETVSDEVSPKINLKEVT